MKIAIIDDHAIVRSSIASVLETTLDTIKTVVEAGSCRELLSNELYDDYDLILLDYHIPHESPPESFKRIRESFPQAKILYISSDEDPKIILDAIQSGASGYVVKSSDIDLLIAAIDLVLVGGKYIPENLISQIRLTPSQSNSFFESSSLIGLSRRQLDVLDLMLQQLPNKIIASKLNISESTVKSHINSIFSVLGIKSRKEVLSLYNNHLNS